MDNTTYDLCFLRKREIFMFQDKQIIDDITQKAYSKDYLTRIAPVKEFKPGIPWSLHLEAYEAHCLRYKTNPDLLDLENKNCMGGFTPHQLDFYIPDWRSRLSSLHKLIDYIKQLEEKNKHLREAVKEAQIGFKTIIDDDVSDLDTDRDYAQTILNRINYYLHLMDL